MSKRQNFEYLFSTSPEYLAASNAPQILAITSSFFAAAAIVVLLRCYVRISVLKVFGIDDYIMVFAATCAAATLACFKIETSCGLGKHFLAILADQSMYRRFFKAIYIHTIIINIGISSVKISVAFSLLRLSPRRLYSRFLYGIIAFIAIMTTASVLSLVFQCLPIHATWNLSLRPPPLGTGTARCYDNITFRNLGFMNSLFNIITDALVASLPIPLIWKLQLNSRTKISLIVVLSLGWFACAASTVKAVQQWHLLEQFDWTVQDSFNIWNYVEFTIGILAASLPPLKPLFNSFLKTARAMTAGSRARGVSAYKGPGSLGYHDMGDHSGKSIALQSFTSQGDGPFTSDTRPYNVQITTQHADTNAWGMNHAKTSDESVLPLHNQAGHNGILMTKEVRVS